MPHHRVAGLAGAISELAGVVGLRLGAWHVCATGQRSDLLPLQRPHFAQRLVLIVLSDAKVKRKRCLRTLGPVP
jgi:hypothetical protein